MSTADLEAYAARIPHMGGRSIGPWLSRWASFVPAGAAIVELGCWLGAGTAQLALGARQSGATIHTYDRWDARASEIRKARDQGVTLRPHQDTLPIVRAHLAPFGVPIVFHRGPIQSATWSGGPIGLYVDDAAKQAASFAHVRRVFWPSLIDGAIVVLMDYHYYEQRGEKYRAQRAVMEAHPDRFVCLADHIAHTSAAAFRYRKAR